MGSAGELGVFVCFREPPTSPETAEAPALLAGDLLTATPTGMDTADDGDGAVVAVAVAVAEE